MRRKFLAFAAAFVLGTATITTGADARSGRGYVGGGYGGYRVGYARGYGGYRVGYARGYARGGYGYGRYGGHGVYGYRGYGGYGYGGYGGYGYGGYGGYGGCTAAMAVTVTAATTDSRLEPSSAVSWLRPPTIRSGLYPLPTATRPDMLPSITDTHRASMWAVAAANEWKRLKGRNGLGYAVDGALLLSAQQSKHRHFPDC